jgi:hypothetical protein
MSSPSAPPPDTDDGDYIQSALQSLGLLDTSALPAPPPAAPSPGADLLPAPAPSDPGSDDYVQSALQSLGLLDSFPSSATGSAADSGPSSPAAPGASADVSQGAAPTIPLNGSGWHQWQAWQAGPDVKGAGLATVFGGGDDPGDNSVGVYGDPITKTTQGVSLPTGMYASTMGSPFPQMPKGTMVTVYNRRTGKSATVPIVDEGPTINDDADTGKPGSAMIDIAPGTAATLGMSGDSTDSVDIRIPGAARYLTQGNYQAPPVDPTDVNPDDASRLQSISQQLTQLGVRNGQPPYDVDAVRAVIPQIQSGALQPYLRTLDGHLDLAENTENSNPKVSRQEYQNAMQVFNQMTSTYGNLTRARTAQVSPLGGL